jgi:hypothetical protein
MRSIFYKEDKDKQLYAKIRIFLVFCQQVDNDLNTLIQFNKKYFIYTQNLICYFKGSAQLFPTSPQTNCYKSKITT